MAKDDYWDKKGYEYDLGAIKVGDLRISGCHDYNCDGVYTWWEADAAELNYYRRMKEFSERNKTTWNSDEDDYDDDEYEEDTSCNNGEQEPDFDMYDKDGEPLYRYVEGGTYDMYGDPIDEFGCTIEQEDDQSQPLMTLQFRVKDTIEGEGNIRTANFIIHEYGDKANLNEYDELLVKRSRFVLQNDTMAAKYLSVYDGFDFSQALVSEWTLPQEFLDNYDITKYLRDNLEKLFEYDMSVAFDAVEWMYKEFSPYKHLDEQNFERMCFALFYSVEYKDNAQAEVVACINNHFDLVMNIFSQEKMEVDCNYLSKPLECAIQQGDAKVATGLVNAYFANPNKKLMSKLDDIKFIVNNQCDEWDNLQAVKFVLDTIVPLLEKHKNKVSSRKIEHIKVLLQQYIQQEEETDDLPIFEQEAQIKPPQDKYAWREREYIKHNPFGINPINYESEFECIRAIKVALLQQEKRRTMTFEDRTEYSFCKVYIANQDVRLIYFVNDIDVSLGDRVVVPYGRENKECEAVVLAVGKCLKYDLPCPVHLVKSVIKKL